ncbi:MAG: hypothetical protein QXK47_01225 [Candidatus Bathyarchaeia archaeon]
MTEPMPALAQEAQCPYCGAIAKRPANLVKEWEATPKEERGKGRIRVFIHLWQCPRCYERFRTATRIWPKQKRAAAPSPGKLKLEKIRKKLQARQGPKH